MKATANLESCRLQLYSWNTEFYEYPDGSGHEGRFTKCGICVQAMKKLGLYDLTPRCAVWTILMSEAGGVTILRGSGTLPGGPYCDCGQYKKIFESWRRQDDEGNLSLP